MQNPYGPRYNRRQASGYRNGVRNNRPGNKYYGNHGREYHNHQAQHNSGNQNNWNGNDRPNQQSNYYQGSFYQQNVPMQPLQNNINQSRPIQPPGGPPPEVHAFDLIGQNGGKRCKRSTNISTRWPGQNGWQS